MQMQTARLEECNVDFAYVDSGAPPKSEDYTTLVCIHGNTYHAQAFQKLLPLAPQHNIRLIALNRRDYIGSTPFTDSELSALLSTDQLKHQQFLYDRGLEIAHFLLFVVNELKVPRVTDDGKRGGLALLGWSLGNITSIAFLANLGRYPKEVVGALELYLRHYFIYEVVYQFLGIPSPEGWYHPLWDDQLPFEQKPQVIDEWFTSYFSHPHFSLPISNPPNDNEEERKRRPPRELSSLQLRTPTSPVRPRTGETRTAEEKRAITDTGPIMRSEIAFYFNVSESTLYEQYKAALSFSSLLASSSSSPSPLPTDDEGALNGSTPTPTPTPTIPLPKMRVSVVDATHTVWNIIWASWEIKKDIERWKAEEGRTVRPVEFVTIEGVNHYAIWDDPEILIRTLASCLK